MKRIVTVMTAGLWMCFLLAYVVAKVHYFTRYQESRYLREHSVIWLAMAAIVFLIWLLSLRKR